MSILLGLVAAGLILTLIILRGRRLEKAAQYEHFQANVKRLSEAVKAAMNEYSEALANIQRVRKEYPATVIPNIRAYAEQTGHPAMDGLLRDPKDKPEGTVLTQQQVLARGWPDNLPQVLEVVTQIKPKVESLTAVPQGLFNGREDEFWGTLREVGLEFQHAYNLIKLSTSMVPALESAHTDVVYIWKEDLKPQLAVVLVVADEKAALLPFNVLSAIQLNIAGIADKYHLLEVKIVSHLDGGNDDWMELSNCLIADLTVMSSLRAYLENLSTENPFKVGDVIRLRRFGIRTDEK